MLRRLAIFVALLAAATTSEVVLTAPAHAAGHVICVGTPAGPCDEHETTIELALGEAAVNGLTNTVLIGPGTYSGGPYSLNGSATGLTLKGSGQGVTTLTMAANATPQVYLKTTSATVRDLTVALAATDSSGDTGLSLDHGTVDHVTVTGQGTVNATAVEGHAESVVSHSSLRLPLEGENVGVHAHGDLTVTDTAITAGYGFVHSSATTDRLSRVSMRVDVRGVWSDWGDVDVDDTLIDLGTSAGSRGIAVENTNNFTGSKSISANHVTIVGGGPSSVGVYAYAAHATALQQATVLLGNSIVRGPATDLRAIAGNDGAQGGDSVATIGTSYSDWHSRSATSLANGAASIALGPGNVDAAPGFRNPSHGDYRLAPWSPVIDHGMPGSSALTLDLDGRARVQDGNGDGTAIRDLGAYEAPRDTVAPGTTITSHPKKHTTKHRVTFGFTSTESHSTFQCRLDKKPWGSCSSPKRMRVTKGWHVFKVRAVDIAHNVDPTPARFRFHRA